MIHRICKFLSKMIVAILFASVSTVAFSATNVPTGDIGDYGAFDTDSNREAFIETLVGENGDLVEFQSEFQKQIVRDYVPIEARVGIAMMGGLNHVAQILDTSLVRFMIIFIIIMYAFWILLETYNMMTTDNNVNKLTMTIVKKTIMIVIWAIVLGIGPAKLFMFFMGPVITLGTYVSDFILNAITSTAGVTIPDTCAAIKDYAATHMSGELIIDGDAAANVLCIPTRLSGFFTTAIAIGWQWIIKGIGFSAFSVLMGAIFTVLFAWNLWKFALMALSVIMNLFLVVLLLPFTAFAETVPQTSYKGIVGNVFNSFVGLFSAKSLKLNAQINKFINATIYFVSLSIIISICAALMAGVIDINTASQMPTLANNGFIPALLSGALVAWLASKASELAGDIGGSVPEDGTGKQFTEDIKNYAKDAYGSVQSWVKAFKASKS